MNPYIDAYTKRSAEIRVHNRRNFFSAGVMAILFLLGLSFLLVYKHTLAQHLLIEVQELKNVQKDLVTEKSVLLGEWQASMSRSRIVEYAQSRLALDFPSPERVLWIRVKSEGAGTEADNGR